MYQIEYNVDNLETGQLRSLIWEGIRSGWKTWNSQTDKPSFDQIWRYISELAVQKGLIENKHQGAGQYQISIKKTSSDRITSLLWELVNQNILYPIINNGNIAYGLSEYGKRVAKSMAPIPHDPDGYLALLKKNIPQIDNVVYRYVQESIYTYNMNLLLSSMTSIGCAAEKSLLLLIEAFSNYIPRENEQKSFLTKTKDRFVKTQFEIFRKSLDGYKGNIEKENKDLTDGIDIVISGLYELLRQNRNSTGHPTGKEINREEVFACLQVFIPYCKRVYDLIDYFNAKALTLEA